MFSKNVIKRIPGNVPPPSKKESQGYIDDLSKKQKFELEELLERQDKILSNKSFISKLPDKGEKIKAFRKKIVNELALKNEVEQAAQLLSRLNIASEGKAAMSELEWTTKYSETPNADKIVELDSDDEEDPLKILAQPTGTGVHKKKVIHVPTEETLVKPKDLEEIKSFQSSELLEVEHVKYILDKVQTSENHTEKKREPFKPYKTTKSNVHDPMKEKERKLHKNWEVTAATPPLTVHGGAKVLSLNESLMLQKDQAEKLQEIQAKHAAERLAEQLGLHKIANLPINVGNYRLHEENESNSHSESEDEENEIHDEDDDKRGTVVYTVESVEH